MEKPIKAERNVKALKCGTGHSRAKYSVLLEGSEIFSLTRGGGQFEVLLQLFLYLPCPFCSSSQTHSCLRFCLNVPVVSCHLALTHALPSMWNILSYWPLLRSSLLLILSAGSHCSHPCAFTHFHGLTLCSFPWALPGWEHWLILLVEIQSLLNQIEV